MTTSGCRSCRWADRLAGHLCEDAKEDEEGGNAFGQNNGHNNFNRRFHYEFNTSVAPQAPERPAHGDKTGDRWQLLQAGQDT